MTSAAAKTSIFLVPGFFGFAAIGDMRYFAHVRPILARLMADRGEEVDIHEVATRPTASLRHRVELLAQEIVGRAPGRRVWVIGHSAGGIDGRLLGCDGLHLGRSQSVFERAQAQLDAVVTIATPHRGTPLATTFVGVSGQRALSALSALAVAVLRRGRLPVKAAVEVLRLLRGLDSGKNIDGALLDHVLNDVLRGLPIDRRDEIARFLQDVRHSQGLLPQLTPEAMDLIDLGYQMRPGVRGGSVMVMARPPRLGTVLDLGFDTASQAMHAIFTWLYRHTASANTDLPELPSAPGLGLETVTASDNDGIVPTASQAWGTVLHLAKGDHLDVLGHFAGPAPDQYDWMPSGSAYDDGRYQRLWTDVADFLTA